MLLRSHQSSFNAHEAFRRKPETRAYPDTMGVLARYTAVGFWRAGKEVFQAQAEAAEGEQERSKAAKEWLALALAEVGTNEESGSINTASNNANRSTARAQTPPARSDDGPTPRPEDQR